MASGQIPNGNQPLQQGQIWTAGTGGQWDTAWQSKADCNNTDIDGGTIDGVTIGGSTPAPGTFTGLSGSVTLNPISSTWSGTNLGQAPLYEGVTWTGSSGATGNPTAFHTILIDDQVDSSQSAGALGFWLRYTVNSSSKKGLATAFDVTLLNSGPSGNTTSADYVAISALCNVTSGDGGTSGSPMGGWSVINPVLQLGSGATYTNGGSGIEIDIGFAVAAVDKIGLLIDQLSSDTTQATIDDAALAMDAQTSSTGKWKVGISFGRSGGYFPFNSSSTLIGGQGFGGAGQQPVGIGIDFRNFTFSDYVFIANGFYVENSGDTETNNLTIGSAIAAGGTVDIKTANGADINILPQGSGTITLGSAVTVGGTITASSGTIDLGSPLFMTQNASINGLTIGQGSTAGASVQIKTANGSNIEINPQGSAYAFMATGFDMIFGGASAIGTAAVSGFALLPFVNGTPSGTPTNEALGAATVLNESSKALNVYVPGTGWYHVALTSGAG